MMTPEREALETMAALLSYPGEDYHPVAAACRAALERSGQTEAAELVARFAGSLAGLSREALQERFTATLDLDPACSLEVGWHLFGENYDRGAFLVEMRDRLQAAGVRETVELPDHLTHVLPLLGRLEEPEAAALAERSVGPAIGRMLAALDARESPFADLLRAVALVVEDLAARQAQGVEDD